MDYTVKRGENKFYVGDSENSTVAEMVYEESNGNLNISHSEVSPDLRGQGIGDKMLDEAADYAREKGYKLSATCLFAEKRLKENADQYEDVI